MDPILALYDVFPARVTYDDGHRVEKARVLITADEIHVFRDDPDGPGVVQDGPITVVSLEGGPLRGITALTEAGLVKVVKTGGCGCGSRVKHVQPFPDRVILMQPRQAG